MNRVRIALALLAGLLALSFFSHRQVLRITGGTLETLYEAREAMRSADYERAAKRAGDAAQQFSHSAHFLEFFIRRESVASASVNLRGIAAYATSENAPDFFNETDKLIEQLAMMQHLYISVF